MWLWISLAAMMVLATAVLRIGLLVVIAAGAGLVAAIALVALALRIPWSRLRWRSRQYSLTTLLGLVTLLSILLACFGSMALRSSSCPT
jgi:hypothetical protein